MSTTRRKTDLSPIEALILEHALGTATTANGQPLAMQRIQELTRERQKLYAHSTSHPFAAPQNAVRIRAINTEIAQLWETLRRERAQRRAQIERALNINVEDEPETTDNAWDDDDEPAASVASVASVAKATARVAASSGASGGSTARTTARATSRRTTKAPTRAVAANAPVPTATATATTAASVASGGASPKPPTARTPHARKTPLGSPSGTRQPTPAPAASYTAPTMAPTKAPSRTARARKPAAPREPDRQAHVAGVA